MNTPDELATTTAKAVMLMPLANDDELHEYLSHQYSVVRVAATKEAAARWAETIMPRGE